MTNKGGKVQETVTVPRKVLIALAKQKAGELKVLQELLRLSPENNS